MTVSALSPEVFKTTPPEKREAVAEPKREDVVLTVQDRIRLRAYELYEARHGEPGDAETDWYRAEAEIVAPSTAEK